MFRTLGIHSRARSACKTLPRVAYSTQNVANRELHVRLHTFVRAFRSHGHMETTLDPLGIAPATKSFELNPALYGLDRVLDDVVFNVDGIVHMGGVSPKPTATLKEIIDHLRSVYCGVAAAQFSHLDSMKEYEWIGRNLEATLNEEIDASVKRKIVTQLIQSEAFDQFMAKKFPAIKRYGLEGCESMIPTMDTALRRFNEQGVSDVIIGMPHRGRLNLLSGLLNYPPRGIFSKCQGNSEIPEELHGSGDVLSHLSIATDLDYGKGSPIHVDLLQNPSHLEAINPVALGKTKAKLVDGRNATTVLVHGDAAFTGQGIVTESLELSKLPHFTTNGTVHLIVNNQIGFTTLPLHSRSTRYSADVGKMVATPTFHVNAEHPEELYRVMNLAVNYREKFKKDVIVEMVGFRRWGHNELDEPSFTQPFMYSIVRNKPSVATIYSQRLITEGVITEAEVSQIKSDEFERLERELAAVPTYKPSFNYFQNEWKGMTQAKNVSQWPATGFDAAQLKAIGLQSVEVPVNFNVHDRLLRTHIEARAKKIEANTIDWATAEAMSVGSLLLEGYNVRLSGQDVGRGTFSQRHWEIIDQKTEKKYHPLSHIPNAPGKLEVAPSPLSELAVLGYEYGYSFNSPRNLVLWEAQFGDFSNGAQIIIDQFIASGEEKWITQTGIVMLLPHGYDGAGPEHSSSKLERYLQLADGRVNTSEEEQERVNMHIIHPTTPANYFHALRRQMHRDFRKPLIVMSPKVLLRLPECNSKIEEMASGTSFKPVLADIVENYATAEDIIIVSGKFYYDLVKEREARNLTSKVGIIRIEELSPFPYKALKSELSRYQLTKAHTDNSGAMALPRLLFVQEEPENMGAYLYCAPRLARYTNKVVYVGREAAGSPAVGYSKKHKEEHTALMNECFSLIAAK